MISLIAALSYILTSLWPWIEYSSLLSEAIEQTRLHMAVIAVAIGISLLLAKRRTAGAIFVLGAAANLLWIYSAYGNTPPTAAESMHGKSIRLLSFNANIKNRDARDIIDIVERSNADFVLIIETSPALKLALQEGLRSSHPYQTQHSETRRSEIVAFSRQPITVSENYPRIGSNDQRILFAPINLDGTIINIYGIHALSPISAGNPTDKRIAIRHRQINQLIGHIATENGVTPFVIAGDMNSAPWHTSMRGLRTVLNARNADRLPSINLTWPTWAPFPLAFPIDHIYQGPGICSTGSGTFDIPGSDHRAVYANLTLCPNN